MILLFPALLPARDVLGAQEERHKFVADRQLSRLVRCLSSPQVALLVVLSRVHR